MEKTQMLTQLLVNGYLRNDMIPLDLITVIMLFINDIFQNDGVHRWRIEDQEIIDKMLTAECGQKFESKTFELVRMEWKLEIYPNGFDEETKGYLVIHLRLIAMPAMIEQIEFWRIFRVEENMSSSSWVITLKESEYENWGRKCSLKELIAMQLNTLTISVEVRIIKLTVKQDVDQMMTQQFGDSMMLKEKLENSKNKVLEYEVKSGELELLQNAEVYKEICSEILDGLWTLSLLVEENDEEEHRFGTYLTLCHFPVDCVAVNVQYILGCKETGNTEECDSTFSLPDELGFGTQSTLVRWQNITDFESLTFSVEIKKVEVERDQDSMTNPLLVSCPIAIAEVLG